MHHNRTWPLDLILLRTQRNRILPVEGGDGSTLTLDFTTGVLDPRLTFTRTSDATFINSSGLVQWAAVNYFRNTGWTGTTFPSQWNPTFGTGTVIWHGDGSVTMDTGVSSTRPVINASTMTVIQGIQYTFGYRVLAASGSPTINNVITSNIVGETFAINGTTVAGSTVVQAGDVVSCTFTTTGTTLTPRLGPGSLGGMTNTSLRITQPQMNPGVTLQPYLLNTSTSAANNNTPRFDYDPTSIGIPRGLLIEGQATNLVLNGSMAYTATAPTSWVRGFSGCTVASVDSTTFLGQKAWSIAATASGQRDLLEQVISLAANTTYTVSVYLEAVTGTTATFAYMTSLPAGATSGTVANPSVGRVSFTVTVGATAGNGTLRIGIGSASGTGVSADASVRFSHVQVEAGSGASSYIPTGASQVTRNSDSCSIPLSSFGFVTTGGTFQVNYRRGEFGTGNRSALNTDYASGRWLGVSHTNASSTALLEWWNGAISRATQVAGPNKYAYSFGANTGSGATLQLPVSLAVNGSTTSGTFGNGTTNGADVPNLANITNMVIGAASQGAPYTTANRDFLNNCVSLVKYWPTRLPDSQLQSLTT